MNRRNVLLGLLTTAFSTLCLKPLVAKEVGDGLALTCIPHPATDIYPPEGKAWIWPQICKMQPDPDLSNPKSWMVTNYVDRANAEQLGLDSQIDLRIAISSGAARLVPVWGVYDSPNPIHFGAYDPPRT